MPLAIDKNGVVKVGGTRVTLDTVVKAFIRGATAEEIAQQYPSVSLSDIYSTISYYLQNRKEVDKYLDKRKKQAQAVKRENEKRLERELTEAHQHLANLAGMAHAMIESARWTKVKTKKEKHENS